MSVVRTFLRRRLDPVPAEHRSRPFANGLAAFAVIGLLLYSGFAFRLPFMGSGGGTLARIAVATADAVSSRTPVRVRGVNVGRVDHVVPGPDGRTAILVLRITDPAVHVRRDARAAVRWRTLLGSVYVELDPGSAASPPLGGGVVGLARTSTQVDWNAFNGMFGQRTRQGQRQMLAALRRALTAPQAHGRTLRVLGPALRAIGRGTRAARGSYDGELTRLVRTTGRTLDVLSRDGDALGRLVAGANRTFAASAHHRQALGEAVALSPAALRATAVTMRRLVPTLDRLDPLVARLRPGARELGPATRALAPALAETTRVLGHARSLLHATPSALRALARAGKQGAPLIGGLRPTVDRLNDELLPWLDRREPDVRLKLYETIGPFFSTQAAFGAEYDAAGHWGRFVAPPADGSLILPCDPNLPLEQTQRCKALDDVFAKVVGGRR